MRWEREYLLLNAHRFFIPLRAEFIAWTRRWLTPALVASAILAYRVPRSKRLDGFGLFTKDGVFNNPALNNEVVAGLNEFRTWWDRGAYRLTREQLRSDFGYAVVRFYLVHPAGESRRRQLELVAAAYSDLAKTRAYKLRQITLHESSSDNETDDGYGGV